MTNPDYLAIIDAKIARLQSLREELLELSAPVLVGAAARPRALPAGKAGPRQLGPGRAGVVPGIIRQLAARGPLRQKELAEALGVGPHVVGFHLRTKTALFRQQEGNNRSPWELTEAGRKAAVVTPPGA